MALKLELFNYDYVFSSILIVSQKVCRLKIDTTL